MDQLLDTISNKDAYVVPPYARDIRLLILTYLQRKSLDLATFKNTWHRLGFSQIWNAKPDDVDKRVYARELFNCVICYFLIESHEFPVKLGALYTIYFLYETQPGPNEKKTKIPMIPHVFHQLLLLREKVKELSIYDAYHCMNRLSIQKAYLYTMSANVDYIIGCIDPSKSLVPDVTQLNEVIKKEWNWEEFSELIRAEERYTREKEELLEMIGTENVSRFDPNDNEYVTQGDDEEEYDALGGNPFSRVTPYYIKELHENIQEHLENRDHQWLILKQDALLRTKKEALLSIDQRVSHDRRNGEDESVAKSTDRADRLVRSLRPENMKEESEDEEEQERLLPRKRKSMNR